MTDEKQFTPGILRYIEHAKKLTAQQENTIQRMKSMRFDTIAVHGLYSVEEALDNNQGAIIEPLYMATSQGYRDSDELEAALSYLIQPGATPGSPIRPHIIWSGRWPFWRDTVPDMTHHVS